MLIWIIVNCSPLYSYELVGTAELRRVCRRMHVLINIIKLTKWVWLLKRFSETTMHLGYTQ